VCWGARMRTEVGRVPVRSLAAVSGIFAVVAATGLALAGAPSSAAGACPDVAFIGARGSGEPDHLVRNGKNIPYHRGMGAPVDFMAKRLEGIVSDYGEQMRALSVVYSADGVEELVSDKSEVVAMAAAGGLGLGNPAAGVAGLSGAAALYYWRHLRPYEASISRGVAQTLIEIKIVLTRCPEEEIVLAGYSQGAMVVHQAELRLEREGNFAALDAIGGTLLLGDGDRVPHSAAKLIGGAPSGGEGVQVYLHGFKAQDVVEPESTVEICAPGDIVCDFSLHTDGTAFYRAGAHAHSSYDQPPQSHFLDAAVDWLAVQMGFKE
jgi:hypothetical protein